VISLAFFGIVLGTLVAIVFGYFLASSLLPEPLRHRFAWALAPGFGLGFCSLIFFLFRRPMFTVEFALLVPICAVWLRRRAWADFTKLFRMSWHPSTLSLVLASALGAVTTGLFLSVDGLPHGYSDGWAIWNTHARLLHRAGSSWKSGLPYTFHGDYPLLTPAVAARFWRYAGEEVPAAGALLGILLSLSGAAVLGLTLKELRDTSLAILFSLVLLGTPLYLDLATSQYADVPLSFFILSTIALICLHLERQPAGSGLLVLAGFAAGCAGWTKNEGLLFVIATSVVLFAGVVLRRSSLRHEFAPFLAGLLVPLFVILFFKFTEVRPNDLIENSTYETLRGVLNLERHITILKHAGTTFWSFGAWAIQPMIPLFALFALRGADRHMLRSSGWLTGSVILACIAAGYYFVYLVTPLSLQYHLDASLDRLMIHLWPSFLLLLGLAARSVGAVYDRPHFVDSGSTGRS
jgi:hypothetical protein